MTFNHSQSVSDKAIGAFESLPPWHVLRVRSNSERAVQTGLRTHQIITFLPSYSETVRWSDRVKVTDRLLFPGYLFARLTAADIPAVLAVAGVVSVLDTNLRPTPVSDEQIENVQRVLSSLLPVEPAAFAVGETITIKQGALKGVSGVVRMHSKGARLVVNIDLLGRSVSVELDASAIAKSACQ
jgi:transcriptional antiterminator RfaH